MKIDELEARLKTLEKQVRTLQDIEEIKKLQRAYGYYIEHWMSQELVDCFSDGPDVVLDLYRGKFLGKEGVKKYYLGMAELVSPEFLHQVMQLSGIVDVDPDGKTARGRWHGWGAIAMPTGGGVAQSFISGIYECEYIKENGKWKIKKLKFSRNYLAPPGEGWVQPERIAAIDPRKVRYQIEPDIPRTFEPGYPSGYILPFHYKHPATGKKTTEGTRNASLKRRRKG